MGAPANGIAIRPDGRYAYVALDSISRVAVIDMTTDAVVEEIPVGLEPLRLAIRSDGAFAYVSNRGSSSLSIIDLASHAVVATVPTPEPGDVALSADDGFVYVTSSATGQVHSSTSRTADRGPFP